MFFSQREATCTHYLDSVLVAMKRYKLTVINLSLGNIIALEDSFASFHHALVEISGWIKLGIDLEVQYKFILEPIQ